MYDNYRWRGAGQHPLDNILRYGFRTEADLELWMRYRNAEPLPANQPSRPERDPDRRSLRSATAGVSRG